MHEENQSRASQDSFGACPHSTQNSYLTKCHCIVATNLLLSNPEICHLPEKLVVYLSEPICMLVDQPHAAEHKPLPHRIAAQSHISVLAGKHGEPD
jgi:hypothetical protein